MKNKMKDGATKLLTQASHPTEYSLVFLRCERFLLGSESKLAS